MVLTGLKIKSGALYIQDKEGKGKKKKKKWSIPRWDRQRVVLKQILRPRSASSTTTLAECDQSLSMNTVREKYDRVAVHKTVITKTNTRVGGGWHCSTKMWIASQKSKLFVLHSIQDKWSSTCGLHQENNTSLNAQTWQWKGWLSYAWLKSEVPKFFSVKSQKLIWMEGLGPQIKTVWNTLH